MKRISAFLLLVLCAVGGGFLLLREQEAVLPPPAPASSEPQAAIAPPPVVITLPEAVPEVPAMEQPAAPSPVEPETATTFLPAGVPPPLPPVRPRDPLEPEIRMSEFRQGSPVFIRIFKRESVLELWARHEGRYRLLKAYPICLWSGELGPKQKTGDYQAPEGFYSVTRKQLHPTSNYHRAFNLGYPNAYDQQLGRTGAALMVHGACASVGCYAMTNAGIAEIYPIVEAALKRGQKEIRVQVFPFRLSDTALKTMAKHPWHDFWKNLKEGYDHFERTREPPQAFACRGRYVLEPEEGSKPGCRKITGWL